MRKNQVNGPVKIGWLNKMSNGFAKVWRKIWQKDYCQDHLLFTMMVYFITHANYQDAEIFFPNVGSIPVKRGEHVFSTVKLAVKLGATRGSIRSKLKMLKKIDFLTIKTNNRFSKVFIINYDLYQMKESELNQRLNQQRTSREPAENQQGAINKKRRRKKKKEEEHTPPTPPKNENEKKGNGVCVLADDFSLTDRLKKYAIDNGIDENKLDFFFEDFKDWAKHKNATSADWNATFRLRVNNAQQYGKHFLKNKDPWEDV